MRYSGSDTPPLSDSADAERMRQYIDACQAAVDAWDDVDYYGNVILPACTTASAVQYWGRMTGAARAMAKQAMWLADGLL